MSLRTEVLTLIQDEDDTQVLAAIRELLLSKGQGWWERIGLAEQASVKRGMEQAKAGLGVPHNQAMKPYGKWL